MLARLKNKKIGHHNIDTQSQTSLPAAWFQELWLNCNCINQLLYMFGSKNVWLRENVLFLPNLLLFALHGVSGCDNRRGGEAGLVSLLPWFSKIWSKHELTAPSPPPLPFFSFSLFPLQQFLKSQREGLDRAESQTPLCGRPLDHLSVSAVGIPRAALGSMTEQVLGTCLLNEGPDGWKQMEAS